MKRRSILSLVLFALPLSRAAAQGPSRTLADGQILRGRFRQERRLAGFNAPLRSEGRFVLVAGQGLIWNPERPFAMTTIITPAGLVQEMGGTEVARLPAARLPFLARLYDMLGGAMAGDWRALEREFAVRRAGTDDSWSMSLTPLKADDPAMPFRHIAVEGSRFVDKVTMAKPDGDSDALEFFEQVLSAEPATPAEAAALSMLKP
ncbi:MAG: hypothetical protein HY059_02225 [Proteobacteria bacterium]|nr:hypothetical protein [Pseudomonadota bacterium]